MSNRFMVSVAAVALIGGAAMAHAQGNNHEGGAAMQQGAPSGGASTGAATHGNNKPSGMSEQKSPGAARNQRAEENVHGQKSGNLKSENETKGTGMKAEGREGPNKNMKAEGREGHGGNMKAEGREGPDKNMKAEGREGHGGNMKAEGREGPNKDMKAEGREGRTNLNAEGRETEHATTGQAGAGAKLSTEQRTKITTVIRNEHVRPIEHADFPVSVGTRVPRERVHLRALPSEVVTVYPEWRGYEFFLVRDEIVVVDPHSLEIVAVLPA